MTPNNDLRPRLQAMWVSVADRWAAYADEVDEMRAGVTAAMLARTQLVSGQRVLELACGPGGVGLAAASLV
nr:methyltransferase type 11 [Pseudonocardiales bacterium]